MSGAPHRGPSCNGGFNYSNTCTRVLTLSLGHPVVGANLKGRRGGGGKKEEEIRAFIGVFLKKRNILIIEQF